jgi:uncharacterized protein (TIGR00106 family)
MKRNLGRKPVEHEALTDVNDGFPHAPSVPPQTSADKALDTVDAVLYETQRKGRASLPAGTTPCPATESGGKAVKVIMDLCIVPIGVGVSVSDHIARCHQVLAGFRVETRLHAYGTNIEGEWDEVFAAVKACHEAVHAMGAPRITTTIKVGTRVDRDQSMDDKVRSVNRKLGIADS